MGLFDSSLDVEAPEAELNAQLERDQAAIGRDRDRAISQRELDRQSRLARIEADRTGAGAEIDRMAAQQQLARERAFDAQRTQSEAELRRAIENWEAAIAQAQTSSTESESGEQPASESGRDVLQWPCLVPPE